MIKYSIVIPCLNEEQSIPELYDRLRAVMEKIGEPFEILFVDDGSTDGSFKLFEEIADIDSRVTVVRLRRRFGRTAALAAGFDQALGEFVLTMDGDLQHDPAEIPRFIEKLDQGYDVVSGWRAHRIDNLWVRRIPSRVANWLMAKLSGVPIHDFGGGFKAYRKEVVKDLPLYGELQRFIPALASAHGASICEIPIRNLPRLYGSSHAGLSRVVPVLFDLITVRFLLAYLSRPMHFFGLYGLLSSFAGGLIGLWLLVRKFVYGVSIMANHGPLMIFAAVLIVAGLQLLALGLLGEMQVRHYHEISRRPRYSVQRVIRAARVEQ
jgi:glycosyltransferase involved in cell wall biosynthesis